MKGPKCNTVVMYVLIVLFMQSKVAWSELTEPLPITMIPGVYWKEIREALVYEASIPLMYKSKWPGVDVAHLNLPEASGFCDKSQSDIQCMLHSWIFQVDKNFEKQLKWINASIDLGTRVPFRSSKTRTARSVNFVGKFAHWCCGIATIKQLKPLISNEKSMSQFEQVLSEQVSEAFAELDNVNLNMKNFSDQVGKTFAQVIDVGINITKVLDKYQKQLFTEGQEINAKSYSLLQISAHQVIRQLQTVQLIARLEILSQCRENKVPNSIITVDKLKSDLDKVAEALNEDGYELVIPADETTKYLKLEIADCIISGENILINLRIPIRKRGAQWTLYEPIVVPFAWKSNTCTIKSDISFLAVNKDQLISIQGPGARDCQPNNNLLCYLPRYPADVGSGSMCPIKMFKGATIGQLSSVCVFNCITGNEPQVSQVDAFTYVITNARGRLNLNCRYSQNSSFEITRNQSMGALELKIPCDCELQVRSQTLVTQAYPCQAREMTSQVIHVIPAAWSKLKSLKISREELQSANKFTTLQECLNEEWPSEIPHFNFSILEHRVPQAPQLIFTREEIDVYSLLSTIIHTVFVLLLLLIIFRNPYLIGLGLAGQTARAESIIKEQYQEKIMSDVVIVISTVLIFICLVLGVKLLKTFCTGCKRCRSDVITGSATKPGDEGVSQLPRGIPLVEVDGKELRVNLEWYDPKDNSGKREVNER